MKVILCIPTLSPEGAGRTAALIKAAEAGTRRPDSYFVVDNGCHFHRQVLGGRYPANIAVRTTGSNVGVGPAWNWALREAGPTDVVIFANDDIQLAPHSIEALVGAAERGATMVSTAGHGFSLFLMTQEHVRKIGYFDEGFAPAYYEDTDYLRRMQLAGVERVIVETGATHREQSTSHDMGWDPWDLINQQSVRYNAKWGGLAGEEQFDHPWDIDTEVLIPSCHTQTLQRLIDSIAWQTVRPIAVTIASNADIKIDTRGLRVKQVKFWSDHYAIGDGDVSLRRNVAAWAAEARHIVYSDDDQVLPQNALEWFARRFATGEHFVVGHHRFVSDIQTNWEALRTASPEIGVSRERYANEEHLWQSCWGGCIGIHKDLLKYGVGGWDLGYSNGEDQQLARRVVGNGDQSVIRVHEPPWAWHEKDAVHGAPWIEPHRNTCQRGAHSMIGTDYGHRCVKCPLVRRVSPEPSGEAWPVVQLFDPAKVRTELVCL